MKILHQLSWLFLFTLVACDEPTPDAQSVEVVHSEPLKDTVSTAPVEQIAPGKTANAPIDTVVQSPNTATKSDKPKKEATTTSKVKEKEPELVSLEQVKEPTPESVFIYEESWSVGDVEGYMSRDEVIAPPPEASESDIYHFVEEMPVYPGGEPAMYLDMQKNLKYPEQEREDGIQGTVYTRFVVEKDGSISNVVVLRSVSGGPGLTNEAIRIVKMLKPFAPARMNGKPVRFEHTIPVKFLLK